MDTVLLVITIVSLIAAFVSLLTLKRFKRADQLPSDARVAALAAASADDAPHPAQSTPAAPAKNPGRWNSVAGEWQWKTEPDGIRDSGFGIRPERIEDDLPFSDSPAQADAMFGTVRREQPASGPLAFVAAAALLVAIAGAVVVFTTSGHEKSSAPALQAAHTEPLELVSLGHTRDARMLTIAGVVRNPAAGSKLEGLTAVVSLIDGNGGLISTKDVPLDYRALGPGEEAPFKVTIPDTGSIARYRVSFRAGTDVVPHVDRRSDAKLASAL